MLRTKAYCASRRWLINLTVWGLYGGRVHCHIPIGRLVSASLAWLIRGRGGLYVPSAAFPGHRNQGKPWAMETEMSLGLPRPSEAERRREGCVLMVKKKAMKERLHDSGGDHVTRRTEPSAEMCYWGFVFLSFICPALIAHFFTSSEMLSSPVSWALNA